MAIDGEETGSPPYVGMVYSQSPELMKTVWNEFLGRHLGQQTTEEHSSSEKARNSRLSGSFLPGGRNPAPDRRGSRM